MAAAIHDTNVKRAEQTRLKTRAQAMLDEATKKCSTGKVCLESTKATIAVYEAAIAGHNAILDRLGPERPENGGYAHAAKVIAALPGVTANAAGIEARLALILPFVTVLITELGTIAFLHLGLGHRTLAKPASEPAAPKAPSGPKGGTRKSRRGATSKDPKVVGFVTEYRRRHGTDPSIPTMQAKFPGMAASTAQRYRRDAGKLGAVATIRAVA